MPALQAFGRKWRIGSDDLVFPYAGSILLRIFWFGLITAVFLTYDRSYECHDEHLLRIYLFILTGFHVAAAIVEVSIVILSTRGTIAKPEPRKHISIPLYISIGIFGLEFAWDIVGVVWAFDPAIDCHRSHSVLILARLVLLWNLFGSVSFASYLFLRIGICRLCFCCCDPVNKKLRYEGGAPSTTYDGHTLADASSEMLVHHRRQRVWQWRLNCLFCWLRLRGAQKTAMSDVAATLADAFNQFRGYVPSDILAGLALYAFHHKTVYSSSEELRKPLDFRNQVVANHFSRAVHYMKFAAAAYGNSGYFEHNGRVWGTAKLTKCCTFGCTCCTKTGENKKGNENEYGVKKGRCGQLAALLNTANVAHDDITFLSLQSQVFCPAFFVALDHEHEAVVVSIRGIRSLKDMVTSLSAEPEIISAHEEGDMYAHKGMMAGAHGVQLKLESNEVLTKAFTAYPNYRLVIVGHSIGAGTAALLAIILKPKYPNLQCFAFSPPGCIIDRDSIAYTRAFITSVVFGRDLLPRLRPESFDTLGINILDLLQNCNVPKYRIFLDYFFYWLGICRPCLLKKKRILSTLEMAINKDPNLISDFDATFDEDDIYDVVADAKLLRTTDRITGKERLTSRAKLPLYIPGRIVHITYGTPHKICCGLFSVPRLQAHWTAQSEFTELTLDGDIFKHHLPYVVLAAMEKLQKQKKLSKKTR